MNPIRQSLRPSEMAAIQPHPRWADGREGYLWCRFDAMLDQSRYLRAEITWDDDGEHPDNESGEPTEYFEAELCLETNRPESPTNASHLVGWDCHVIPITNREAITLVTNDPAEILRKYAEAISQLEFWTPEKGYGQSGKLITDSTLETACPTRS